MQELKKKKHGSAITTLIISNREMNDVLKNFQALEDSNILLKGVTKTINNETKEQKGGFLVILLGSLLASLLGKILTGKGIITAGSGNKQGREILRTGYGNKNFFLILPHPLKNFEIQKYHQNEPKLFNRGFSRDILPKR